MADSQVKTANICNITNGTRLNSNSGGSGTYIADNSISVHMTSDGRASGIYVDTLPEQGVIGDKYTISFVPVCAINNVMLVVLYGTTTQVSFTSGNRYTLTITATATDNIMAFFGANSVEKTIIIKDIQIEKGETATPYRPYSATGWLHSLRKLTTATDTFTTLPADIYADGNNATVGLKGSTVQNGTPTPQNPIQPSECGDRTGNLFDYTTMATSVENSYLNSDGTIRASNDWNISDYIPCDGTEFTLSYVGGNTPAVCLYDENKQYITGKSYNTGGASIKWAITITSQTVAKYIRFTYCKANPPSGDTLSSIALNTGDTALPYEPYGIKIPISSNSTTTPVYLGEVQSTRRIKKLVLDGTENWYSNHLSANLFNLDIVDYVKDTNATICLCTHYKAQRNISLWTNVQDKSVCFFDTISDLFYLRDSDFSTVADFKTYLEQQYAAGTPVTVWYVLAAPTTGIVNEPIRKIGDYADEVSGITIPTITGADSFDVLTTLKPSEVSLSYTGWHDSSVKEWDGSEWQ